MTTIYLKNGTQIDADIDFEDLVKQLQSDVVEAVATDSEYIVLSEIVAFRK